MEADPSLIWQIFRAIEKNERGENFWNLLENSNSNDGRVYMTFASQTPETLTEELNRKHLQKLLQIHQQLTYFRCRFID